MSLAFPLGQRLIQNNPAPLTDTTMLHTITEQQK